MAQTRAASGTQHVPLTTAARAPPARRNWPTIPQVFIGGEFVVRFSTGEPAEKTA
jgi:glutaredoxin-related protein